MDEVEAVFGEEKTKNGFHLGEKLSPQLRREAEKLYYKCYQKPFAPKHVAKEFAIGRKIPVPTTPNCGGPRETGEGKLG